MAEKIAIVRRFFDTHVADDRETAEGLLAANLRFYSPYDNGINRELYFSRCWKTHKRITKVEFAHAVQNGDNVFVIADCHTDNGEIFRNCEMHTVHNGRITKIEVYFGWNKPHKAPEGEFVTLSEA